jgi:hypothetical protein
MNFSIPDPGSRVPKILDPHKRIQVFLTQKSVSKLSEKWSRMFILDPDPDFFPSRIQGSKKHWIPDPQHCIEGKIPT